MAIDQHNYGLGGLQISRLLKLLVLHLLANPQTVGSIPYPSKYGQVRYRTFAEAFYAQGGWTGQDFEDLLLALIRPERWRPSPQTLYVSVLDSLTKYELLRYEVRHRTARGDPRKKLLASAIPRMHRVLVYRLNDNPSSDPSRPIRSMIDKDRCELLPHIFDCDRLLHAVDRFCYGGTSFLAAGDESTVRAVEGVPMGMLAVIMLLVVGILRQPELLASFSYPPKRKVQRFPTYLEAFECKGGLSRAELRDVINQLINAQKWQCSVGLMYEEVIPALEWLGLTRRSGTLVTLTASADGDRLWESLRRGLAPHFRDLRRMLDTTNRICYLGLLHLQRQ